MVSLQLELWCVYYTICTSTHQRVPEFLHAKMRECFVLLIVKVVAEKKGFKYCLKHVNCTYKNNFILSPLCTIHCIA